MECEVSRCGLRRSNNLQLLEIHAGGSGRTGELQAFERQPLEFLEDAHGRTIVKVHQIVRDLQGQLVSEALVEHVYTIEEGLIRKMDVRQL